MIYFMKPLKCSECGSTRSESFEREIEHGVRCLDCGHEKKKLRIPQLDSCVAYTSKDIKNTF